MGGIYFGAAYFAQYSSAIVTAAIEYDGLAGVVALTPRLDSAVRALPRLDGIVTINPVG